MASYITPEEIQEINDDRSLTPEERFAAADWLVTQRRAAVELPSGSPSDGAATPAP